MTRQYEVKSPLKRDGEQFTPGQPIDLDDKEAAPLWRAGVIGERLVPAVEEPVQPESAGGGKSTAPESGKAAAGHEGKAKTKTAKKPAAKQKAAKKPAAKTPAAKDQADKTNDPAQTEAGGGDKASPTDTGQPTDGAPEDRTSETE